MTEQRSGGRILVIDDQDSTRYVFRRILTHTGFQVEEARTGGEGLAMALSAPDVIISDVNLPDMLGYEVCRRLKSNPITASIPVLQISASFVTNESKVQALQGGADTYLTQPVEPTVLVAQINALLRMRRAESLSHLSALQWQTTFDALSDGLALADTHHKLVRANATFMQLFELVLTDIADKSLADVLASRFDLDFAELVKNSRARQSSEVAYDNRWFRIRYDPIQSGPADLSGSILIVTEITEHKKLQETLKLSERLAATGRLAHIIAHEINNPLEAMSNLIYLASQDGQELGDIKAYIDQASTELLRISRITKQVLAYHRESTRPMLISSKEILEGVLAIFQTHIRNNRIHLLARLDCSEEVLVNPGEIRQVLSNLVTNALDAMSNNTGTLRVRCINAVSYPSGTRGVRFLFSDSGPGISPEVLPRIFDAFYTTKESKGSGIGLWLSAEVLGKHRGHTRVRTRTEGRYKGTLFDVFLPIPKKGVERAAAPRTEPFGNEKS